MEKWGAYIHIDGEDVSYYRYFEFDISDEEYGKIQGAIAKGIRLRDCEFSDQLEKKAEESFDFNGELGLDSNRPVRDDFDNVSDYIDALNEFNQEHSNPWNDYTLVDIKLNDPGEYEEFKSQFVGSVFPDYAGEEECEIDFDNDDLEIRRYYVTINFDSEGTILDIVSLTCLGLESENMRGSEWGDCYPDYEFATEKLRSILDGEDFDFDFLEDDEDEEDF